MLGKGDHLLERESKTKLFGYTGILYYCATTCILFTFDKFQKL